MEQRNTYERNHFAVHSFIIEKLVADSAFGHVTALLNRAMILRCSRNAAFYKSLPKHICLWQMMLHLPRQRVRWFAS